jgi:hypothetical protein
MTLEALERIKEEYTYLQDQIQSLKLECAKLAQEKTEMQRHYVMACPIADYAFGRPINDFDFKYYEMSYGLNVEMSSIRLVLQS